MRIHNIKTGFSTNSSSSHSIIFIKPGSVVDDLDGVDGNNRYGWGAFTLTSAAEKLGYLGAQLAEQLAEDIGSSLALKLAAQLVGVDLSDETSVDHQSTIDLPRAWDGKGLDLEFVQEFAAFLRRADVAVLGGNDNDGEHPLHNAAAQWKDALPREGYGQLVARKDPLGYWSIYNRTTGARARMSFDDAPAPTKASAPELVDLKITDFCPYGCGYCYQGSTKAGEHADVEAVRRILYTLGALRVFEIAIGGGEPTMHPNFVEIVATAAYSGIVPNFTTRNLAYVTSPLSAAVIEQCGGFAVSVETATDVEQLTTCVTGSARKKLSVQHVVGLDEYATTRVIRACQEHKIRLTLLGYKHTGRGATHAKKLKLRESDRWLKDLAEAIGHGHTTIAIDTVLADRFYDSLIKRGVPAWCLTRKEGQFSAYIDAVKGIMYRSSYEADDVGVPLGKDAAAYTAAYAQL